MVDRIEIAKKFIQEQIRKRDDIVGAIVTGSVSRGEEVEPSDIDMSLIVEGNVEGHQRGGVDTWQDGVYIDAKTVLEGDYADLEKVLQNPFRATHINDGLILYDPTGFFTRMQKEYGLFLWSPSGLVCGFSFGWKGPGKICLGCKNQSKSETLWEFVRM